MKLCMQACFSHPDGHCPIRVSTQSASILNFSSFSSSIRCRPDTHEDGGSRIPEDGIVSVVALQAIALNHTLRQGRGLGSQAGQRALRALPLPPDYSYRACCRLYPVYYSCAEPPTLQPGVAQSTWNRARQSHVRTQFLPLLHDSGVV
jgi:hypothetical protein